MAEIDLRESYRSEDIAHMLHGATVPSEFAQSVNKIYVEGHGVRLRDIDGKEYIDGMSCGFCAGIGYGNKELAEAARSQMEKLHGCMSFANRANQPEIDLARMLSKKMPAGLRRFMFVNSGSDANDTAFKTARYYWREKGLDKYKIISIENSYHGATFGAMSASSFPGFVHKHFGPEVPGFVKVKSPYCYRCAFGKSYPACNIECAEALDEVIGREGEESVAAFLSEPVCSVAGTLVPPKEYWPKVMEILKKRRVLLIIDEVISGFGRMGRFWASEHWDIKPDMMVFAKGLASAYMPIAGLSVSDEIYDGITKSDVPYPHVFTFGGHPVSCAVAVKHLEILERDNLIEKGAQMGLYLLDRLRTIQKESSHIGDVRGMGLDYGIELVADKATKEPFNPEQRVGMRIRALLLEKGIIVGGFGPNNITLGPPLIISKDELDHVVDGLEWAIRSVLG